MDKRKLDEMRKKLLAKKQELVETVTQDESEGRGFDESGTQDLADKASNSYTKEFLFGLSDTERTLLQAVDGALARLKDGTFGICLACGEPMQSKRLEALPWASHCLSCQEAVERGA